MKSIRTWAVTVTVAAAMSGGLFLRTDAACAQELQQLQAGQIQTVANALIQFETATRWESMQPSWRARRAPWIARVRSAVTAQQLAALTLELETIMTWEAMYPAWRTERPGWVARTRAATSFHDVAQLLLALEVATTWAAMYEDRWRPARSAWMASLNAI